MAPAAAAKMDRVLIRDTDHLAHFAGNLASARASRAFADVVIHCAPVDPVGDKDKGKPRSRAYPTVRVHRAVLASISDFLSGVLGAFPLEEDVHMTLDATPLQVVERIVEFAYGGEVKIAKPLVSTVCDAAHRLQVKFLKDSFVKITDKDYAAVKAGKKTLASLKAEAVAATKPGAPKRGASDSDSAGSDNEASKAGKKNKPAAKGKGTTATNKDQKAVGDVKAPGNVVFTVLKNTTPGAKDAGFVVLNGKGGKQTVAASSLPQGIITTSAQRIVTTTGGVQAGGTLPSPLASIKNPLPPTALPRVKKVMIPPTAVLQPGQKIALPGQSPPPAVITLPKGMSPTKAGTNLVTSPQKVVNLNAFQLQTIRQPDGTEIQVLKQPSGHIMKQLKSTKSPPLQPQLPTQPLTLAGTQQRPLLPTSPIAVIRTSDGKLVTTSGTPLRAVSAATVAAGQPGRPAQTGKQGGKGAGKKQQGSKVPSRMPPKDALAIAMEAIVGNKPGGNAAASAPVALPSSPIPVSEILSPGTKAVLPSKPIPSAVVKSVSKRSTPVAVVSPPGYGSPKRVAVTTSGATTQPPVPLPTVPSAVISAARHSLSQSKLAIPSTVPDDFLMTDDSSENGSNGKKDEVAPKGGAQKKASEPAVSNKVSDTPSRSSGRVRKQNRKYTDKEAATTEVTTNAKGGNKTPAAGRKRKADTKVQEEEAPAPKKTATTNNTTVKTTTTTTSRRAAAKKAAEAVAPSSARQKAKAAAEKGKAAAVSNRANNKKGAAAAASTPPAKSKKASTPAMPRGAAAIAALAPGYSSSGRTLRKRL